MKLCHSSSHVTQCATQTCWHRRRDALTWLSPGSKGMCDTTCLTLALQMIGKYFVCLFLFFFCVCFFVFLFLFFLLHFLLKTLFHHIINTCKISNKQHITSCNISKTQGGFDKRNLNMLYLKISLNMYISLSNIENIAKVLESYSK